jgi:hypothetical protein
MKDARIESLRSEFQPIVRRWLHAVVDDLDMKVRVLETLRSPERQAEVRAAGKSQLRVGWHNVGLALDFAAFDDDGVYLKDDASGLYTRCGLVAEWMGCVWGGRWETLRDYGHIEFHPGFTLQQFLNGQKGGIVA